MPLPEGEFFEWLIAARDRYRTLDHLNDQPVFVAGFDLVDEHTIDAWFDAMQGA